MAGDWIKMRVGLWTHPKVVTLSSQVSVTRSHAIGALHCAWCVADQHADEDGRVQMTAAALDSVCETPGMAAAMGSIGWLIIGDGWLQFVDYQQHNGITGKQRADAQKRQKLSRSRHAFVTDSSRSHRDKSVTREEKRREEEKDISGPAKPVEGEEKPKRKEPTGPHADAIRGFRDAWASRYGSPYPINGGKDGAAVKWMLSQVGGDVSRFLAVVGRYLADGSEFVTSNRHTLGILRAGFAKWLPDSNIRPPPRETPEQIAERERIRMEKVNAPLDRPNPMQEMYYQRMRDNGTPD